MASSDFPVPDTGTIRRISHRSIIEPMQFTAEGYEESLIFRKRAVEAQKEQAKEDGYKECERFVTGNDTDSVSSVHGQGSTGAGSTTGGSVVSRAEQLRRFSGL